MASTSSVSLGVEFTICAEGRHHFAVDRTSCGDNLQPAIILALRKTQVEIAHEELGGRLPRDTRVQLRSLVRVFVRRAPKQSSTLRGGGQGRRVDVEKTREGGEAVKVSVDQCVLRG